MSGPAVSIVILNWNGKHLLADCLGSVQRQTFRDFEVILVDNGSTDGSVEWVRAEYPEVRVVPLATNEGFCGGNNAGIRVARGEYIVLLNNGTDRFSGRVRTIHENQVEIEAKYASLKIPMQDVAEMGPSA